MRRILLSIATVSLLGVVPGCAHYDRARADYHEKRAQRASAKGNYGTAEKQQRKADEAERDLRIDESHH